jgi:hypothetical protein
MGKAKATALPILSHPTADNTSCIVLGARPSKVPSAVSVAAGAFEPAGGVSLLSSLEGGCRTARRLRGTNVRIALPLITPGRTFFRRLSRHLGRQTPSLP